MSISNVLSKALFVPSSNGFVNFNTENILNITPANITNPKPHPPDVFS